MKVLIVEDELLIAKVYSIHLTRAGHQVLATVTNPTDAWQKLNELKPDIVLLDVQLKGGADGISFARSMREKCQCPIIFTTGNSYSRTLEATSDIANCAVLTKPVEVDVLMRKMTEMCRK